MGWVHLSGATGGGARRGRKNGPDLFHPPVNYDFKTETPLRELVEVAAYIHMDLEEAGFTPEEVRRIGAILGNLAKSVGVGEN